MRVLFEIGLLALLGMAVLFAALVSVMLLRALFGRSPDYEEARRRYEAFREKVEREIDDVDRNMHR